MPAITIKESPMYHNTSPYNKNGVACKFLVGQLVDLDPALHIDKTVSDTEGEYNVFVRVTGSNVGWHVYNSSRDLYFRLCAWNANEDVIYHGNSSTLKVQHFFGYYANSTDADSYKAFLKVSTVGVDGVLKYAVFSNSYTEGSACLYYGNFTSDTNTTPVYAVGCSTYNRPAWPTPPAINVCTSFPGYMYNADQDVVESLGYTSHTNVTPWVRAGYQYGLMPTGVSAYTSTKGFVNLKWGGAYKLYALYDVNTVAVQTLFGETVSINGVSTLSGGAVALIV